MASQRHEIGDIVDGLEVTAVSYQEVDGQKVNFSYTFMDPKDIVRPEEPVEEE